MKTAQKVEALRLRIEHNLSLSQIAKLTGLSKATLSVCLRQHQLPKSVLHEYAKKSQKIGAAANKMKAAERRFQNREIGAKLVLENSKFRDLCLLYWGEGTKYLGKSGFTICNADPQMIKFITKCLADIGYFDEIVATSYCYSHSDAERVKAYWTDIIGKPVRVYIQKTSSASKWVRGDRLPNGTMRLDVNKAQLFNMVMGGIEQLKMLG